MAQAQFTSAATQLTYHIDPTLLEPDEIAYERDIRPSTGDTPGAAITLDAGAIAQRMDQERLTQTDPTTIGHKDGEDVNALTTELTSCIETIDRIRDGVESQVILAAARIIPRNAPTLASRLKHYEYRLKRLPREKLTPEQGPLFEKALRAIILAQSLLAGLLQVNEYGHAVLIQDISMSSFQSEQNGSTSPLLNSTMNHGQSNHTTNGPPQPQAPSNQPMDHTTGVHVQQPQPQMNNTPIQDTRSNVPQPQLDSNRIARGLNFMADDARQATGVTFNAQQNTVHQYDDTLRYIRRGRYQPNNFTFQSFDPYRTPNYTPQEQMPNAQATRQPQTMPNGQPHGQHQQQQPMQAGQPQAPPPQQQTYTQQRHTVPPASTFAGPHHEQSQQAQFSGTNRPQAPPQAQPTTAPGMQNSSFPTGSVYHPSTTPYPHYYQEDPLQLQMGAMPSAATTTNSMNPCQAQQYLGRMLSNRRYEGYHTDNNKQYVALDEFIGLIRQYQVSTGAPDRYVLNQVATFMTGSAFIWWKSNGTTIQSITDMENRLRARFERQATDETSILIEFASRKQNKDEDLLDFIDEMKQRFARCSAQINEWKAVEIIVNNTNEIHNSVLAARPYDSLEHLSRHAEYLMRGKSRKAPQGFRSQQTDRRPMFNKPRVNVVEEIHEGDNNNTEEIEQQVSCEAVNTEDLTAIVINAIKSAFRPKSQQRGTKPNSQERIEMNAQSARGMENSAVICTNCLRWGHAYASCSEIKVIRCYGCGKEGVIKPNCDVCNKQPPKNS